MRTPKSYFVVRSLTQRQYKNYLEKNNNKKNWDMTNIDESYDKKFKILAAYARDGKTICGIMIYETFWLYGEFNEPPNHNIIALESHKNWRKMGVEQVFIQELKQISNLILVQYPGHQEEFYRKYAFEALNLIFPSQYMPNILSNNNILCLKKKIFCG
jgi:hypothetical protein